MKTAIFALALSFATSSAFATAITNGGFSAGSLNGWTKNGTVAVAIDTNGSYAQLTGNNGANVYTTLTQTLHLNAGDVFSGQAKFIAGDYLPYNDDAFVSISGVNLFAASVSSVGNYGSTALTSFTWTALTAGDYILNMGVENRGDNGNNSFLQVRNFAVTSVVPEPGSIALLGLGLLGFAGSRRWAAKSKQA